MAPSDNHMPDVNRPKHSLMSTEADLQVRAGHGASDNWVEQDQLKSSVLDAKTCRVPMRRRRRKADFKDEGISSALCRWVVMHQIGLSVNLILLHALTHVCFPRARQSTRKFHLLSYHNPNSGKYALGWDDFYMVLYSIVVLTGLRAAIMNHVLEPIAQAFGVARKKDRVRFAEQGWLIFYDSTVWSLGMYIMYQHEHWLNLRELWTGWPNRELEGSMKWYYLVQFAFWLQQILVVNIEERRKDFWQMFTHHIITCALMFASYGYHQTKVGNMILCLMDVVDIILSVAKILKYLQFSLACDIMFGVFMLVWAITRHVLYLAVVYSIYKDIPEQITYGCYSGSTETLKGPFDPPDRFMHLIDPFRDPNGVVCWNNDIKWGFIYTLLALQVILCIWFVMIIRVAVKVLRGNEAEDIRSDDEGDDEEEVEEDDNEVVEKPHIPAQSELEEKDHQHEDPIELPPLEEEVGAEAISFTNSRSSPARRFRKSGGVASGVKLPSDRKDLLGRIGCDKQPD